MPEQIAATYRFYSWLRQGLLAGLSGPGTSSPPTAGRLALPIRLRVNDRAPIDVNVQLYGPGDITGLDAREIIRTEPHAHMTDFEPNYFPAIEFDRPDFPWLFSPATPDGARRLRPWICLIVVPKERAILKTNQQPLPTITCSREELPDLDQSWAWAHAQIVGEQRSTPDPSPRATLQQILNNHPERTLSRLLAPRRLDPNTAYYACLVPTYEVGRKTGLGEPITPEDEQALKPAWVKTATPGSITLPVFFQWEFRTGIAGDFESLARRLTPQPLPSSVGLRPVDIRTPGWGMPVLPPGAPGSLLDLGGALLTPETQPRDWPDQPRKTFQSALGAILNAPATMAGTSGAPALLGPPLYGQWYVDRDSLPSADQPPHWFRDLNLDPRHRIAAGIGTMVIRKEQESLMASAWDQLEQQRRDRQRLKRAQLAESVGVSLSKKHFAALDPAKLLQLTGPAMQTLAGIATSPTTPPAATTSNLLNGHPAVTGAFRRLTRMNGPIASHAATFDALRLPATSPASTAGQAFRPLMQFSVATKQRQVPALREWSEVKAEVLRRLSPKDAVLAAVKQTMPTVESTELTTFSPSFPQPMYEPLRDYAPDLLLPGMDLVPSNTIALLKTNPALIEAYLVGLNHEMSRELLWRGFPTDQRGTYFRQFWDAGGDELLTTDAEREARFDITRITSWAADSRLGSHSARGAVVGQMVLLIRGDLLRRYPRAMVYALESVWSADGTRRELGTTERYPIFRATQSPDITMLGFPLTEDQVRGADNKAGGHPGWFFVLQEQPTEPRFGMDVATTFGGTPAHWSDLTWGHLAPDEAALKQIVYVPIDGLLNNRIVDQIQWGKNSAQMATITRQPPFRVAVHARTWLPARQ